MIEELNTLLLSFKIPILNRDLSSARNVNWLLRNLPIQNKEHPKLNEAMDKLTKLAKNEIHNISNFNWKC